MEPAEPKVSLTKVSTTPDIAPSAAKHTTGHIDCPACAAFLDSSGEADMGHNVERAGAVWLESHSCYIKKSTLKSYREYVKALGNFFGDLPMNAMHIGHVRAYQSERKAGATRINAELSALQMITKELGCWQKVFALYRPMPLPKTKVRQNMSEEEERRLMIVALERPKRRMAGHCLLIMANTTMGFGELRHLTRGDVHLDEDPAFVEVNGGTKNDYRRRIIPLNFVALRSMRWIVKRWQTLGGTNPAGYILPHRARTCGGPPDFTEPMGHIYRAARGILKEAGLDHLDPYDMRSHAITKLLSNPNVSEQVYEEIAGHVSKRMRQRYSRQRLETKSAAVNAMCKKPVESEREPPKLLMFQGGNGRRK